MFMRASDGPCRRSASRSLSAGNPAHRRGGRARRGRWPPPSTSAASAPTSSRSSGSRPRVPVASAKTVSPSAGVCTGQIARANPSCAICASFAACVFVSRALVATTAERRVLGRRGGTGSAARRSRRTSASDRPSSVRTPATTCAGRRIDDVADGVDRDERGDDQPVRQDDRGAADAAFHRALHAARASRPSRPRPRRRCPRRPAPVARGCAAAR